MLSILRHRLTRSYDPLVEYFIYCRDRTGSMPRRMELVEAHWSFMDPYGDAMIARGPTLLDDETATGSMHVVDLPDAAAARAFAFDEPNYRAGVYGDVLMRRWRTIAGGRMWDYTGGVDGYERFLVIGHARLGQGAARESLDDDYRRYLTGPGLGDRVIVAGTLLSEDGAEWMGTALMVELPDREAAEAMLPQGPGGRAGLYESVEVHSWEFGGRR
ncbi:YciI family protein [Nonomuraea sp. ATR24]|uniref:YciI family protein n=1 Tax=Nonomuraea TaxID=83681 RepID=UPI002484CB27|nr:YciI family protein [Nonomuraea ceibae]